MPLPRPDVTDASPRAAVPLKPDGSLTDGPTIVQDEAGDLQSVSLGERGISWSSEDLRVYSERRGKAALGWPDGMSAGPALLRREPEESTSE